jgi:hypothetical protein
MLKTLAVKPVSGASTLAAAPAIIIPLGHTNVLTVGTGMEFATLGDALKAATAGMTIAVEAGTYTNDFGTVSQNVNIVAVGGLVHEVATVPPPNDKGILTVDANLNISGFTFTGGSDGSPDGNVAGIRLETGNLNVAYCAFSGMQEGLLADPNPNGTVTVDHSYFLANGTGDGMSHNLYVGAVRSLLVQNSVFQAANVGHEIKSRAASTTIQNNVIVDGPTGTGSYNIDLPNGGVAKVTGNIIEKGPHASNEVAIHYGGETQYAWAQNSLDVSGNTIMNDLAASVQSWAVDNQSAVNGLNVVAQIHGNAFWGYAGSYIGMGAANIYGNTALSAEPGYGTASPLAGLPQTVLGQGPELLHLTNGNHTIGGGSHQLIVCDSAGSNTIGGGAGGLIISANAGWDQITTAANAADTINLPGRNSVVISNGADRINASGAYELVEAFGRASITGSGFSTYDLNGAGEVLNDSNGGVLNVGASASAVVHDSYGDIALGMQAGGQIIVTDSAGAGWGLANAVATVNGAASGTIANSGTIVLVTGAGGASVTGGGGALVVTGGAGNDTMVAAGGTDVFALGGGTDSIVFAGGSASVTAGSGADSFVVKSGGGGTYTVTGFQQGTDTLSFQGFSGAAIASGGVQNGNTILNLSDGSTLDLAGVALAGYPVLGNGSGGNGNGNGNGSGGSGGSGGNGGATNGTLTTQGHAITGGASLLTLLDVAGGNTISGGAGGINVTVAYSDVLNTAAGSADTVSLSCYDTLAGAGADQVSASGYRNQISETAAASVALLGTANTVQGGAGLLQIADALGGNTVTGGTGGLALALSGTNDQVTTSAAAADTVGLAGYSRLLSQGSDQITLTGVANAVTVTGAAAIEAGGWATFALNGTESLTDSGSFAATVGSGAAAIASLGVAGGQGGQVTVAATASLALTQALPGGGTASVTVTGGQAICDAQGGGWAGITIIAGPGTHIVTGGGPVTVNSPGAPGMAGVDLTAGGGNVTLNGGAGNDCFHGGGGQAQLNLGGGADTITFGSGAATINAGGADLFNVTPESSGTAIINNWTAGDSIGGTAAPVSETVTGGSLMLTYQGGQQIMLVGVTHFP